jgi:hypothetical protein
VVTVKKTAAFLLIFGLSVSPVLADFSGGINSTGFFGSFGSWGGFGSIKSAAGSACSPGGPTGQMDFSVCSNVGITAALW